jgi:site-specific DNA recombinase
MARRAAIYLRESKLEKEDRWGIPVQRQHALDYCKEKGYEIAGEYVDPEGDSYEVYRPALERLRTDMREGKIDVIVVDRFDRMARTEPLMDFIRRKPRYSMMWTWSSRCPASSLT